MREIALNESNINRLKEYPLQDVFSTESTIYYYKRDHEEGSLLLKKLFLTDEKRVGRKEETIDRLQESELATYKELVIPQDIVTIGGVKSGFTIKEVEDCRNLHLLLKDYSVPTKRKIEILRKIGDLVKRVECQEQEFYFGDLQDYNFLVDNADDVYAVDLDSSAVSRKKPLDTKYIIIDKKTHGIEKYKVNKAGRAYPSRNVDRYCYNTMVLNFLAGLEMNRVSFQEYFQYIDYLANVGIIPEEMRQVYINHYSDKDNELVTDYLEEVPEENGRGRFKVYQALQKIKQK